MNIIEKNFDGTGLKIGIVLSRFNSQVGEGLLKACEARLLALGVAAEDITLATVPGALETPVVLQEMANSEKFDALVALGAIIRGETYHFELVSNESGAGITRVSLDLGVPIANGILTVDNDAQASARVVQKGKDCAMAAVEMANFCLTIQDGEDAS